MKKGIAWIILITNHYDEAFSFYKDKLGFKVEKEIKTEQFCQFSLDNCFLAIYGQDQVKQLLAERHLGTPGSAIYSLPDSQDIDQDYESLKAKGVTFIKQPATQPWGQRTAYFVDPDGHIWELQQWLK